mmetsp:Transcript_11146/g.29668  ORF Transcript_11146/g.29668 Transcript_11146/m.29668 type:complete len:216 (+) Transcript_11146:464-1111(+)
MPTSSWWATHLRALPGPVQSFWSQPTLMTTRSATPCSSQNPRRQVLASSAPSLLGRQCISISVSAASAIKTPRISFDWPSTMHCGTGPITSSTSISPRLEKRSWRRFGSTCVGLSCRSCSTCTTRRRASWRRPRTTCGLVMPIRWGPRFAACTSGALRDPPTPALRSLACGATGSPTRRHTWKTPTWTSGSGRRTGGCRHTGSPARRVMHGACLC